MSSKPNSESSRQIKQMVNFIMQEAHEKVNEIRIKVSEDLTLHDNSYDVWEYNFSN